MSNNSMTKEQQEEFNKELDSLLVKYNITLVPIIQIQELPVKEIIEEAKIKEEQPTA